MISSHYETHKIENSVLPFIFYPSFKMSRRIKNPNWHKSLEFLQCIDGEGFGRCDTRVVLLRKNLECISHPVFLLRKNPPFPQERANDYTVFETEIC